MSHPVWVCGLKHFKQNCLFLQHLSHPVWVCGLKPMMTGVTTPKLCHTLYGCVDWNNLHVGEEVTVSCHTLYGCVDWNKINLVTLDLVPVTPCMGVWIETWYGLNLNFISQVTPCMGVWIETKLDKQISISKLGHTLYGCVDWNWGR